MDVGFQGSFVTNSTSLSWITGTSRTRGSHQIINFLLRLFDGSSKDISCFDVMLRYATLYYANHTILQVLPIFFKAFFLARHPIPPLNAKGIALMYCWGKTTPSSQS